MDAGEPRDSRRESRPCQCLCIGSLRGGSPIADRFHVSKNLTEATQLLLARCQAEIAAAGQMGEPTPNESGLPVVEISEWRHKEPPHVKNVRLQRRAGREARYEQVIRTSA